MFLLKRYNYTLPILLISLLGVFGNCNKSNKISGDKEVTILKKYFPNATEINIDTLENGVEYNFLNGDSQCEVFFDSVSNFKYAATYIEPESLPGAIKNTLKKKYDLESITVVRLLKFPNKTIYSIEIQMPTDFYSLECSEDGKILKIYKSELSPSEGAAQEEEGVDND